VHSTANAMEQGPGPKSIRILCLDDHALFREGLVRLLSPEPDFTVVGQSSGVTEGVELLRQSTPDLVLLDNELEDGSGIHFLRAASRSGYNGKILLVTAQLTGQDALHALRQGASGIVLKHNSPAVLIKAIRLVMGGHLWIDPRVVQLMAETVPAEEERTLSGEFSERERQVLEGVVEGLTNRTIGSRMGVSESTVKATLQRLFLKTGVRTRSQLVRVALQRPIHKTR
jgi:DNA-binding NarL/FixJ family response regulator